MSGSDPRLNDVGTDGWVSAQEIRNLDVEMMRELDKYVWPIGTTPSRDHVMKFLETWKYRLVARAKQNREEFMPDYLARQSARLKADKVAAEASDSRELYSSRMAALRGRTG